MYRSALPGRYTEWGYELRKKRKEQALTKAKKDMSKKAKEIAKKKFKEPLEVIFDRESHLLLRKINKELLQVWSDNIYSADIWASTEREQIGKKRERIQEDLKKINRKITTLNQEREEKLNDLMEREWYILWRELIKEERRNGIFQGGEI